MNINFQSSTLTVPRAPLQKEQQDYAGELKIILMRKLTWLVLVSYTLLLFKPAMPVFMDVLAHTFWEQQHLMTVHEVHGKFHVHYETVNAGHQSNKDKQAANNRPEVQEYLPVTAAVFYTPAMFRFEKSYSRYSPFYSFSCLDIDNPPPDAMLQ